MEIEIALNDRYIVPKWPLIFYDNSIFVVIILFGFPRTFSVSLTLNDTPEVSRSDRKENGEGGRGGERFGKLSNRVTAAKEISKAAEHDDGQNDAYFTRCKLFR